MWFELYRRQADKIPIKRIPPDMYQFVNCQPCQSKIEVLSNRCRYACRTSARRLCASSLTEVITDIQPKEDSKTKQKKKKLSMGILSTKYRMDGFLKPLSTSSCASSRTCRADQPHIYLDFGYTVFISEALYCSI